LKLDFLGDIFEVNLILLMKKANYLKR